MGWGSGSQEKEGVLQQPSPLKSILLFLVLNEIAIPETPKSVHACLQVSPAMVKMSGSLL